VTKAAVKTLAVNFVLAVITVAFEMTVREEGYSPHRAGTPAIGSLNTGSRAYWIVLRDMNEAN